MSIKYEKKNQIAYVTISNIDKGNILDRQTSDDISEAWKDIWEASVSYTHLTLPTISSV